jgi:class 3 adenylate cyclase/tetratricopeptide (TPR) repeat protein
MQQIADWLKNLGLSEYAQRFTENDIDLDVLSDLTDEDLKDLGVSLGHRRKILRAIRALGSDTPVLGRTSAVSEPQPKDSAERRHVTVMFADLVGSTALASRMDPEDLREIIAAYQKCVTDNVRRFDGFVAKYMGDGVLVYFGYPQAHEDDADRAVRAGLELIAAVTRLAPAASASLQTRVGIATGLVVIGEIIGSGEARERGIVGETPNLAARLQGIAEPNMVVIAESTRRLLGNLFELEDLGGRELKGITGPVPAWAALRARSVESRFEALHANELTALVGREEELEILLRRWARAKTGEGQVVLISGEGGIGKSRITAALLERLADEPHRRLRYFCSPLHTDSAFYPVIGQMERAAGLAHGDTTKVKLDKLDAMLAQSEASPQDAAPIAEMLSLPNDGRYPTLELAPQQRRQRTMEALIAQVEALSRQKPVLIIFEDAQWTDPSSVELFGRAIYRIVSLRVLLVVTFRPEFEPPWIGQPQVTALTINRLAHRDVGAMIDRVVGNYPLPASIRQDIVERADGIPLFVEEMTKAVLEAESEDAARRTVAAVPSPAVAVPASLHASLMARLDRLGQAKEVAQIGAAIGREFSHLLVAAVARKPQAELKWALDRLIGAGLLFRQGMPPYATYLFKHALVQDAAYGTLLREGRRALHMRIAESLESQFSEIVENQPELLAHHCTEAGLIEKAAYQWGKAGQRLLERSALIEAMAHLKRALAGIASLLSTPALRREQIQFQVGLANALMQTRGFAAPETKAAVEQAHSFIEQAEALGEPPEDPLLLFSILYGFWAANCLAINGDAMLELAAQFLTLAQKQKATAPVGHNLMGTSLLITGNVAAAKAHFDQACALFDPIEHGPLATSFGVDFQVAFLSWRSWPQWLTGHPEAALRDACHALNRAREISHATSLTHALNFTQFPYLWSGDYVSAAALADELVAFADEKGALFWKAHGMMNQGGVLASSGRASDAIETLTAGVNAWRATGATLWMPMQFSYLAIANAELGRFDDAWRYIGEATAAAETTREVWYEAEVHRTGGEIALMAPKSDAAKAEVYFERALKIARQQQAKSWELRAAMSMARLWRDQGKRQQARNLLVPVYGWFTEGFDTLDLKQARALLDELTR